MFHFYSFQEKTLKNRLTRCEAYSTVQNAQQLIPQHKDEWQSEHRQQSTPQNSPRQISLPLRPLSVNTHTGNAPFGA
jgi:hypothetical protein